VWKIDAGEGGEERDEGGRKRETGEEGEESREKRKEKKVRRRVTKSASSIQGTSLTRTHSTYHPDALGMLVPRGTSLCSSSEGSWISQ
jgi:hypothetical protein